MSKTLLPVAVLSGFLGAGKTPRLNRVLRNCEGRRVAVIEPVGRWWSASPKSRWLQDETLRREIEARWKEPWGARRPENVFVGDEHLDEAAVRKALDRCQLTFTETRKGMPAWRELRDSFQGWQRTQAEAQA
jgi:G3E family GTPase